MTNTIKLPTIDPRVQHVGLTTLRQLNATRLRDLEKVLVIQDQEEPLAVVVPYALFMKMQAIVLLKEHKGDLCGSKLSE